MKRIYALTFLVISGLMFSGCELDSDENFHFVPLNITEADIPDFFVLNQSHQIDVTFVRPNSCTYFQGFDVFTDENRITTIVAIGSVLTQEECLDTQELLTDIVTIMVNENQAHTLRFYIGEDAEGNPKYDEHQVPVVDTVNQ